MQEFEKKLTGRLLSKNNDDLWEHQHDVEVLLIKEMENPGVWKVIVKPGKHVANGMKIEINDDLYCDVMVREKDGSLLVQFDDVELVRGL